MDDTFNYPCRMNTPHAPSWVGDPATREPSADERLLIDNRDHILVWGYAQDEDAGYEFDEMALVSLFGMFYLVQTSGCSCPSPGEMWHVEWSGDIDTLWRKVIAGEYTGYTLPKWAQDHMNRAFSMAKGMTT